ncbi:uncharacterized protein [Branchiostoma lanceolatum]|uniref:uncharacterized protein n=1 Tax=Branchiostoma lanceolatum TaxID=7740 RepID=UPI003451F394
MRPSAPRETIARAALPDCHVDRRPQPAHAALPSRSFRCSLPAYRRIAPPTDPAGPSNMPACCPLTHPASQPRLPCPSHLCLPSLKPEPPAATCADHAAVSLSHHAACQAVNPPAPTEEPSTLPPRAATACNLPRPPCLPATVSRPRCSRAGPSQTSDRRSLAEPRAADRRLPTPA